MQRSIQSARSPAKQRAVEDADGEKTIDQMLTEKRAELVKLEKQVRVWV
jgi:hypothetical protein